jgi:nicotinate-nucleotide pyrophosphorylase (carboxylating)
MSSSHFDSLNIARVRKLLLLGIEEDAIHNDVTTNLCIKENQHSVANIIAKDEFVLCGLVLLPILYEELKFPILINKKFNDGDIVKSGQIIAELSGNTRHILSSERLSLNLLQHLSGIASKTRKIANKAKDFILLDTRKTLPGLRDIQKYAVRVGGAQNHRLDLSKMIMLKNNHIDALGGDLHKALEFVASKNINNIPLEVEVRNMEELAIALKFKPSRIMLDNMTNDNILVAVKSIRSVSGAIQIEVSGGVTEDRLVSLNELGIDFVSMGSLTNSVASVDISLRIVKE